MHDSLSGFKVAEVNAEIPRKVCLDSLTIKVLSGAVLTFLAGIALLAWIAYGTLTGLHTRNILRRDGQLVYGEITKTSVNRGGEDVSYTFLADGVMYSGHAEMEADRYTVPGDTKKIPLRYLPHDPRVNQPIKWQWVSVHDFSPVSASAGHYGHCSKSDDHGSAAGDAGAPRSCCGGKSDSVREEASYCFGARALFS